MPAEGDNLPSRQALGRFDSVCLALLPSQGPCCSLTILSRRSEHDAGRERRKGKRRQSWCCFSAVMLDCQWSKHNADVHARTSVC